MPASQKQTQNQNGMMYAPQDTVSKAVLKPGQLTFASCHLDHGHIYGMTQSLIDSGAELKWVFEPDDKKFQTFEKSFPKAKRATSIEQVLDDPQIKLVAAAAVPSYRAPLGIRVLHASKHYFTDKCPMTTLDQLAEVKAAVKKTGYSYKVYYSERLQSESAMFATKLIEDGVIGKVIHVIGLGPHRLAAPTRPEWFFKKENYGGIITDIGSHQVEQFLTFASAKDAKITMARVGNFNNKNYPELEDLGEFSLTADNGVSGYFKLDWFTPDGLSIWGDGRTFVTGTEGTIEIRKYVDVATENAGDVVILVNKEGEFRYPCAGKVGFPFFNAYALDLVNGTENAMTQEHAFKAAEISLLAQQVAENNKI